MTREEARQQAYQIGLALQPANAPGKTFIHTRGDVAHLTEAVLQETHPLSSMPPQRSQWEAYEKWAKEQDDIRESIYRAYLDGTAGLPLQPW